MSSIVRKRVKWILSDPGMASGAAGLLLVLLLIGLSCSQLDEYGVLQSEVRSQLKNIPFEMPVIAVPRFPDRAFPITQFGAVGDGQTLNTEAFNKAIRHCSQSGGGRVVVPPGLWLTGPIELQSDVNLHLERGALVVFSPDHTYYPVIDPPKRGFTAAPPIAGFNLENIAITGEGILDGSGDSWRPVKRFKTTDSQWEDLLKSGGVLDEAGRIWWPTREALNGKRYVRELEATKNKKERTPQDYLPARDYLRPHMVLLINCKKVLIDGLTIQNSPKFALYPNWCTDVVVRNVKINNEWWAQNGDGIDISSCKNVLIYDCIVTAGDDAICMKSSDDKKIKNPTLQNVVIRDCIAYHGHGGYVMGSNLDGGARNIFVDNCNFIGTDIGLRFKCARDRGGVVENIHIQNVYMKDIVKEAILFNTFYENLGKGAASAPVTPTTPIFKNIYIDSVYSIDSDRAVLMIGLPEMPLQAIRIRDSYFSAKLGFTAIYAKGVRLENVGIVPRRDPIFDIKQSKGFVLQTIAFPGDRAVFMSLAGERSDSIRIVDTDLSSLEAPMQLSPEVSENAVILE